ncbi:hypothetical protein LCGC14_2183800 [marine sediment metagenome]|uniref:DUF4376 domain-containing protein n=1 Tax=marine sediment metagenome TaxID=412755 RepID=A0A0F9GHA3_9ZZZZ
MANIIIYRLVDNSIRIGYPADATDLDIEAARVMADVNFPAGASYRIVDDTALPTFWPFQGAWRDDGVNLTVDMTEAGNIQQTRIDKAGTVELEKLSLLELIDDVLRPIDKQTIRDAMVAFDPSTAIVPQDLVNSWPTAILA